MQTPPPSQPRPPQPPQPPPPRVFNITRAAGKASVQRSPSGVQAFGGVTSDDEGTLGSAGMTGCLINFKYIMFSAQRLDGKWCLSWQRGGSTHTLCCSFWSLPAPARRSNHNFCSPARAFVSHTTAASVPLLLHAENTRANIFVWGRQVSHLHRSSMCPFPGTAEHLFHPAIPSASV